MLALGKYVLWKTETEATQIFSCLPCGSARWQICGQHQLRLRARKSQLLYYFETVCASSGSSPLLTTINFYHNIWTICLVRSNFVILAAQRSARRPPPLFIQCERFWTIWRVGARGSMVPFDICLTSSYLQLLYTCPWRCRICSVALCQWRQQPTAPHESSDCLSSNYWMTTPDQSPLDSGARALDDLLLGGKYLMLD